MHSRRSPSPSDVHPRTVFLGTSQFAAAVLEQLAATQAPQLILTRPDRPSGRGRRLHAPPVADAARRLALPLAQPERVNDPPARERIAAAAPDLLIVCAYGALIKEPLLGEYEILNVHPSLLPRWRGAAPIERAIMAGDAQTGVSIMRLTAGLDSGPVALAVAEPIGRADTYGTLAERLQVLGAELLLGALHEWRSGSLTFTEQAEQGITYAEKITAADRLLDPTRPAIELERQVRALAPHIGARIALPDGELLGVQQAVVVTADPGAGEDQPAPGVSEDQPAPGTGEDQPAPGVSEDQPAPGTGEDQPAPGVSEDQPAPGTGEDQPAPGASDDQPAPGVSDDQPAPGASDDQPPAGTLAAVGGRLLYGSGEGVLQLLHVQPPGGRPMDAAAYLRGHAR
jgi:methionyl-tRNA formyltransferase